jgi:DNA invertase Pin-like site-specific DNA recombinase
MDSTEVLTPQHLARTAGISIRQATPHQALSHQESLRRQDALTERAQAWGWAPEAMEVVDRDVGHRAASTRHRAGFHTLVGPVTLGPVGLLLSYDVTRRARHGSDWYPLFNLCRQKGGGIADVDGLDDPATANGRVLLGCKGTLSAWELHTLRARMTAGLLPQAARGDLALTRPTGLEREAQGRVPQDPNLDVPSRIALVFSTFLPRRSASKVRECFNAQGWRGPRRDRVGEVLGKRPTVAAILTILKHPADAGTVPSGRTRPLRTGTGHGRAATKRLTMEPGRMRVPETDPASISWATFAQIQTMRRDHHADEDRHNTRGIPRPGNALWHGLVSCGGCGHKRVVPYQGGTESRWNS